MKANEFIKEYGIDTARECLGERPKSWESCYLKLSNFELVKYIPSPLDFIDIDDLKRLIESHELVDSCGGLHSVGEKLTHGMYESRAVIDRLEQAIADVESCQ